MSMPRGIPQLLRPPRREPTVDERLAFMRRLAKWLADVAAHPGTKA
jgi:hypothetical protein